MLLACDLHIHSCLSPCADMTMTPNNLVNMAYLKGLDMIAVADHNSAKNLPACKAAADERNMLLLPAIEAESREEGHVLCYFPTVESALAMGGYLYQHLPDIKNSPELFGEQIAMNSEDVPIYREEKLLIQSTTLSIDSIADRCRAFGGVPVPAHINRSSNSLISSLGFVPPQSGFTALEVYRGLPAAGVDVDQYHILYSSDAHYLENILERENFINVRERSIGSVLEYLSSKKDV